jgi:hypothetical protein
MHHSTETQEDYDERSVLEQVAPAQQLMLDLARGQLPYADAAEPSVEALAATVRQLPMQDFERLMVLLGRSTH